MPVFCARFIHRRSAADLTDLLYQLKSWKFPENEFTKTEKVTLRRLLSHTAGLTVGGFAGYKADEPLPSTVQILRGEKPANNEAQPWRDCHSSLLGNGCLRRISQNAVCLSGEFN